MSQSELRRGARYDVQLACHVVSPFRDFENISGMTLNMSRNGLLLLVDEDDVSRIMPQVGNPARIVLQLPGVGAEAGRCVECLGRVVRVDSGKDLRRVAFEFRRFQFIHFPPFGDASPGEPSESD